MKQVFNKWIIAFCLILGFSGLSSAQYAPTAEDQSLLWRISGNGLKEASFLYGTIHIIPKKDFFIADTVRNALLASDRVAFEIDMDDATNLWGQLSLMRRMLMRGDTTLDMLLSKKDYALVKKKMAINSNGLKIFDRIKPMFLTTLMSAKASPGATESYEMNFYTLAKDNDKKVEGLETMKYQMSVFDTIPYKAQAEMLVESVKKDATGESEMDDLVKLYKAQDLIGLGEMFKTDDGLMKYDDIMLNNRNRNWIPAMSKKMKKRKYFFAVGAGHLVGQKGVVALLRKSGFTVEPILFKFKHVKN